MRKNEYQNLKEFCEEYDGREYPDHQSFIGIEFTYHGVYYRMCREPLPDSELPTLPDGRKGRYRVVIVHWHDGWFSDFDYELVGWFADLDDLLQNCQLDGKHFAAVIMDDTTEIVGKD